MSRFARSADWLRQLFTPSRTGWEPPGRVADEVVLTQPYDGGGFPLWPPGQYVVMATGVVGAAGSLVLQAPIGAKEIGRILAIAVQTVAAAHPSCFAHVVGPGADVVGITAIGLPTVVAEMLPLQVYCPILPPSYGVDIRWYGGDATTQILATALIARAPIGSTFYV